MTATILSDIINRITDILNEHPLDPAEITVLYGKLGYVLGASIEGFTSQGPPLEILEKAYYTAPSLGVSLMLQGLLVEGWAEDWKLRPSRSKILEEYQKKGEEE